MRRGMGSDQMPRLLTNVVPSPVQDRQVLTLLGHKCKSSQLYMLMIQNDGRDKEEDEVKISLIVVLQKE